jgi:hypothetical protein
MAYSKNNENIIPFLDGSKGEQIFYIITLINFQMEKHWDKV